MEQIAQLKEMRDDALARLQYNPDYKLLVSLDRLIRDLDHLIKGEAPSGSFGSVLPMVNKDKPKSETSHRPDQTSARSSVSEDLEAVIDAIDEDDVNDDDSVKTVEKKTVFSSGFGKDEDKTKGYKSSTA